MKKEKGFTLIELLAVIVILGIILLIAMPLILNVIDDAKKGSFKSSAGYLIVSAENEYMKRMLNNEMTEDIIYKYENGKIKGEKDLNYKGETPKDGIIVVRQDGKIGIAINNGKWCAIKNYEDTDYKVVNLKEEECKIEVEESNDLDITTNEDGIKVITAASVSKIMMSNKLSSDTFIARWNGLNDKVEESFVEFIKIKGNLHIKKEDADASGNYYIGTALAGTASNGMDEYMLVLNIEGNLTIDEGVKLIPNARKKGMFIYVSGILTNNGEISMTARGAYAVGQDINLIQNEDESYEYIPAVGAVGGARVTTGAFNSVTPGIKGTDGNNRTTGGGGSGARNRSTSSTPVLESGAGSKGTSYSGGTGGGALSRGSSGGQGENGHEYGGKGGNRYGNTGGTSGGGVGNPTGSGDGVASSGTGGLLVIFANSIYNNQKVTANGVAAATGLFAGGGSSGGGSINIFYKTHYENNGIIEALGGVSASKGGAGGNGSVTISLYK